MNMNKPDWKERFVGLRPNDTIIVPSIHSTTPLYQGLVKDLYPELTQYKLFKQCIDSYNATKQEKEILKKEVAYMYDWMSVNDKTIDDFLSDVVTTDSLIYKIWLDEWSFRVRIDKRFQIRLLNRENH